MEYVSEAAAAEAAKKHQEVELSGHKLYVIKSMIDRVMGFGETTFSCYLVACFCQFAYYV